VQYRYFTHFYIWGTVWIWTVTTVYFYHCFSLPIPSFKFISVLVNLIHYVTGGYLEKCAVITRHHVDVAIVLSMLSVQVFRRLYECVFVSVLSKGARMHLVHYILGMFFYPAMAFTSLLHLDSISDEEVSIAFSFCKNIQYHFYNVLTTLLHFFPSALSHWTVFATYSVAVLLFLWASLHQYRCHKILADLRHSKRDNSYRLPKGDWFQLVSCPHFMAEVLIYSAMLLVMVVADVWTVWWLVIVYTVSTLGLSARQTHMWYKDKFEDYPRTRCAMIPFFF